MASEEGLGAHVERAGEDVAQAEGARFIQCASDQSATDAFSLEARDGVEADDFADAIGDERFSLERTHAGEVVRADLGTEAVQEDARRLAGSARLEVALALAARDETLDLLEVIQAETLDAAVVLQGEQRARPLVGEQFTRQPVEGAQIHRPHAGAQRRAHRVEGRSARRQARPFSLAGLQHRRQEGVVHERNRRSLRRADASLGLRQHQLVNAQATGELLSKVDKSLGVNDADHQRPLAQRQPGRGERRVEVRGATQVDERLRGAASSGDEREAARGVRRHDAALQPAAHVLQSTRRSAARRNSEQDDDTRLVGDEFAQDAAQRLETAICVTVAQRRRDAQGVRMELVEIELFLAEILRRLYRRLRAHRHNADASIAPRSGKRVPARTPCDHLHARLQARDGATGVRNMVIEQVAGAPMRRVVLKAVSVLVGVALAAHPSAAASGQRGMIASEHPRASAAGLRILQEGGNAVDAAVATALAVGVVNPTSCGIGGGGFMLIYTQATRQAVALDYRETAPAAATSAMFVRDGQVVPGLSVLGGLAVATPGEIAGLFAALARHGTRPFGVVAAPAIALARDGFAVAPHLAGAIARREELIRARPDLARILLHTDGTPLRAGDTLRQPDLARTLERIAAEGPAAYYEGPIAAQIAAATRATGGILSPRDLAGYRPVWRTPLRGRLDGYTVYGMPPPSSGGGVIITALNALAGDDLRALGHNSPTYVHLVVEALQFGFADRAALYGDPAFTPVPLRRLLAPARGRALRQRISAPTTFSPRWYGDAVVPSDSGTSHLSVVDGAGNAVACTTSINTSFGSLVVAGNTGIILNNTMDDFSPQPGVANAFGLVGSLANGVAPGKRPLSSMAPTVVTREDAVAAVAGGSGGPFIISGTLQVLLNALVFGLDADAAVAAPRLHHQWLPPVLLLEPGFGPGERRALSRLGHRIGDAPPFAPAVQLVTRAPDGALDGAADPRKGGQAAGW